VTRGRKSSTHCRDCGRRFGPNLTKPVRGGGRCKPCKARYHREYQRLRAAGELEPVGDRSSQDADADRSAAAAFRDEQARARTRARSVGLARQCEFCLHGEPDGLLRERCTLGCEPDESGGCEAWDPRYRVDDDDECEAMEICDVQRCA
jgi:hypothetical protein